MKVHHHLKKLLMRSLLCPALTLMTASLVLPAQADSFTVDGVDQTWDASSGTVRVNDVPDANTAILVDGKLAPTVNLYTGSVTGGDSSGNALTVSNSELAMIQGSRVVGDGTATDNSVEVKDSTVSGSVYGAIVTKNGAASDNSVSITGGEVGSISGGCVTLDGKTNNNSISVTNATVTGQIMGGYMYANGGNSSSLTNEASHNSVTLTNSQAANKNIMGAYILGNGKATHNTVTLDGCTAGRGLYGAYMKSTAAGLATNEVTWNSVTIKNGSTLSKGVMAAYATYANATHNSLTIQDSTVTGDTAAAFVEKDGDATHNTVTIENSSVTADDVIAGAAVNGKATNNTVILRGNSQIKAILWGGKTWDGSDAVTGNTLSMEGFTGNIGRVYNFDTIEQMGGSATIGDGSLKAATSIRIAGAEDGTAASLASGTRDLAVSAGKSVDISNATLSATGALTLSSAGGVMLNEAEVSGSSVTITAGQGVSISNATLNATGALTISGGYSATAEVSQQALAVTNSTITGSAQSYLCGGESVAKDASGNTLTASGSSISGSLYGGYSHEADALDNKVILKGNPLARAGQSFDSVYGGRSDGGTTSGNHVYLEGVTVSSVWGGMSTGGAANDNVVELAGCTIAEKVCGGEASGNEHASASGNMVSLDDCTITGSDGAIYGGYITGGSGSATGNTVILKSGMSGDTLSNVTISGGGADAAHADSCELLEGNTLELDGFRGSVAGLYNFEAIDITLTNWTTGEPIISATGGDTDLSGVKKVSVSMNPMDAGDDLPAVGDTLALFGNMVGTENLDIDTTGLQNVLKGIGKLYDIDVEVRDGVLSVTSLDERANPQTKALSEGRVATMAFVNRAGNLIAEEGLAQASLAAAAPQGGAGAAAFFAMSAGHDKVDSGSHVNVDGIATMLGASAGLLKDKALTLGGFIESGWGQYTTHNSFTNAASVRGTGESSYCGGGVLFRYDGSRLGAEGLAVEASFRAGRQDTDFSSYDIGGKFVGYELNSSYLAGHVGATYSFDVANKVRATAYARYLWSHAGSDHATIEGEQVDFDAVHSNRLRFGARAAWQGFAKWKPYAGLAFEWECSGAANATVGGDRVDAPSMRGGSVIGEIGTTWQPWETRPLWLHGGIQGSAGKTQGYGANVGCTIAF